MKYLAIILLLFAFNVSGQSVDHNLAIHIVNDSLQTFSSNPEITLSLRCKNNGDKNLLLYGFDSNLLTMYVDRICANLERAGGGIGVLVFNEKNEREYAVHSIHDSIAYTPMPKERFEQLMEQGKLKYLTGTKVLKGSECIYVDKKIDLYEFKPLKKGTYYLQLIYFAGNSLVTKTVGKEQIEKDKRAHNAQLYQGCAISNTITFRVD